jgi:hypothetical protein
MKNSFIIISYLENTSKSENHSHQRFLHLESPQRLMQGSSRTPSSKNNECPHCGSPEHRTGAGRKPQEASLHCRECKRFLRWIAASELKSIAKNK